MIDEFMIPGGESSFNELNHIENPFNNKSSIVRYFILSLLDIYQSAVNTFGLQSSRYFT